MIYNKKIEVIFDERDERILDGQSKICNWLYNQLLAMVKDDYENNNNINKLLNGRNLRNQVPKIKKDNPFLKTVHSSPLKNVALRLKDAFDAFFKGLHKYPKYRPFKKKWFSLFFDEANKGFKVLDPRTLRVSLGKDGNNKQMSVVGYLCEPFKLKKEETLKTFRLCKQQGGHFYAIFTVERIEPEYKKVEKWIAIDQNHKNFFVAIDYKGETFEFEKLFQDKYFDAIIDKLKSKRDKCNYKHELRETYHGKQYSVPNKRWKKLNHALNKAYTRRREQTKLIMYAIAHYIAKHYDKVIIGDYVPSKETAGDERAHRSVINQSHVGAFRQILKWVMDKAHKVYLMVSEYRTTKTCCVCGDLEDKAPDVREFTCKKCNTFMLRDVNSAVNMAKKDGLTVKDPHLDRIDKIGKFIFKEQKLKVA